MYLLQILTEEITPTLGKLKEERSQYLEYQKVQRELEHLTKLYVAYRFVQAEVRLPVDYMNSPCNYWPEYSFQFLVVGFTYFFMSFCVLVYNNLLVGFS